MVSPGASESFLTDLSILIQNFRGNHLFMNSVVAIFRNIPMVRVCIAQENSRRRVQLYEFIIRVRQSCAFTEV